MSLGGDDNLLNLRALHYKNNLGKADDYPSYTASVKYDGRENACLLYTSDAADE